MTERKRGNIVNVLRTLGELVLEGSTLARPKPLLLLAYLALEGPTSRRKLAELFYGQTKDPLDSLTTALGYLRRHPPSQIMLAPRLVSTEVACDVTLMLDELREGRVEAALGRYQAPFLASYDQPLTEELEDWVYAQQDKVAQRLREALLDYAEGRAPTEAADLAERAWLLTKDQGFDPASFARLYSFLSDGKSPSVYEMQRVSSEYGLPLVMPRRDSEAVSGSSSLAPSTAPAHVETLAGRLENLRYSTGGLALCLWGEAGIGKSWTLQKLRSVLSLPSYFLPASLPLQLVPQHIPRAAALPAWTRTALARLAAGETSDPERAADAIAEVLASHAPVVLQVEDMHEASLEADFLWCRVAEAVKRIPGVALVTTSRRPPSGEFEEQRLGALNAAAAAELLRLEAAGSLPKESAEWIYERALGNPLFTLEYFRYLHRRGHLWRGSRIWRWRAPEVKDLPASVEALVLRAVNEVGMDDHALTLAQFRALLPPTTPLEVVKRVSGLEGLEAEGAETRLAEWGVFHVPTGNFVHPLYAEAFREALAPLERQRLATQVVVGLAQEDPVTAALFVDDATQAEENLLDLLTRAASLSAAKGHARLAGDFLIKAAAFAPGKAKLDLLLKAGRHLRDVSTRRAREVSERVLVAEPENAEALFLLAECLVKLGEGERAEAMLGRVSSEQGEGRLFDLLVRLRAERNDYAGAAEAWLKRPARRAASPSAASRAAFSLANLGRFEEADTLASSTLARSEASPEERAELLEVQGVVAYYRGEVRRARSFCDGAVAELRRSDGEAPSRQLMGVLRLRAAISWALLDQSRAVRDTEEAMGVAVALGDGRAYAITQAYLGVPLTETGEYERAEEELLESREVLRRADAREHLSACEAILGGVYINWQLPGMVARGREHIYTSLRISEEIGAPVLVSQSCLYVAWAENLAGNPQAGEAFASRGLSIGLETGQLRYASLCYWMRGLARGLLGRVEEATADLDAAIRLSEQMGLEGFRLLFSIDRDCFRGDREGLRRHLAAAAPCNFSGLTFPLRQRFMKELGF